MRIVGFMALHYGADYISYAIESMIDHVDVLHVAYSPIGSHGEQASIPCPETEMLLKALAHKAAGNKLVWHRANWRNEGAQRDMIYQWEPDADIIVVTDSDEVWDGGLLNDSVGMLKHIIEHPAEHYANTEHPRIRNYRVPMVHYWRSFHRCIIHDPSLPVRLVCPKMGGENEGTIPREWGYINHFGYAIRPSLMRYKWLIHGHRGEYRTSWFDNTYLNKERDTDLHPVGNSSWNYDIVTPLDYMPDWMQSHPFYDKDWIE